MSGKVHSEHIAATKILMPMGGGVSGKVHYEHIYATSTRYAIDIRIAFLLIHFVVTQLLYVIFHFLSDALT